MKRLAVLLVLLAALVLPLAAAYGGNSPAPSTPAPAVQAPVVDHGKGDCPYASINASI